MATAIETCNVCGHRFNTTRSGDKHRVIDFKYTLMRHSKTGKLIRIIEDENTEFNVNSWKEEGYKISSEHGEHRRCLSPEEMKMIGMRQEKNGAWNGGGTWANAPWKN